MQQHICGCSCLLHHDYAGLPQLLSAVAGSLAADLQQFSAVGSISNTNSQQQPQQQQQQQQRQRGTATKPTTSLIA
jgi:hypothetical protein